MIVLKQLNKSFGKNPVLQNISFEFSAGKVYGMVGQNGAGKTTLFRCLAGLESYKGIIERSGQSEKAYLGYVPAELHFLAKLTGAEYLRLMLQARNRKLDSLESINVFDLPLNEYIVSYSTGMKKKLSILGALLQDNHVFIFDEVYNGLDFQSCLLLTDIIKRLKKENKLVLISSHVFALLEETCDEILYLKDGTIARSSDRSEFPNLKTFLSEDMNANNLDTLFDQLKSP
ncbi:ATP-binding cassette domain-containing protein [Sphingobacterium corticis]|uniref:ATP-binding cassette domain-containing protein n=1 Tax=Sphingobacterium corticis TaxID=1812823 RepID=A0ABW5NJF2_9SPHI